MRVAVFPNEIEEPRDNPLMVTDFYDSESTILIIDEDDKYFLVITTIIDFGSGVITVPPACYPIPTAVLARYIYNRPIGH